MKNYREAMSFILKYKGHLAVLLGFSILLFLFSITMRGASITDKLYDAIRKTSERKEVAIIGIDDKSLQALGAWPWNRSVFADLERALTKDKVRLSVYDVLFLEPRQGDDAFKQAVEDGNHPVILGAKHDANEYLSSYLGATSSIFLNAVANVSPDSDGKVRYYALPFMQGDGCTQPLSTLAFSLYTKRDTPCSVVPTQFRYPESITTYSLIDVISGTIPENALLDKVVFIGSTSLDLEDHFVGMAGNKIPGVYVHASMFVSKLNSVSDTNIPSSLAFLLILVSGMLAVLCVIRMRSAYFQAGSLILLSVVSIVAGVIFFSYGKLLPTVWMIVNIFVNAGYVTIVRFLEERKKNEQIESLFAKYVHKDVLDELMHSGNEVKLGGERKPVTVLFSDLRGFTSLSESMSPEDLTSILNAYLSEMTPHVLEEKGTIDKFIGDAIMAFWNAPLPVEDHPHRALVSALRMHAALKGFNEDRGTSLAIGIGVHTGPAIVGNVGGRDRVNYTILGDTVNLTSRIEGLTKKYGVGTIVTKAVRDTIDDPALAFRTLDVITVLGKSTPTTLYEARFAKDFKDGLIDDYEKAFKYYYEMQWNKAETIWKRLAKEGDTASTKMLERIPELRMRESWDGIWRFDEK
jgi:class 3 adenylate cyclase/CHASE2 domain-containing sensor protein